MSAGDALRRVVSALDRSSIPHMLAGSHASSFHGIPRTTRDIDIVIEADETSLRALVERLADADFYVSEPAALDALRRGSMFNVIDNVTGWKTDLVLLPRDDFALTQWERRDRAIVMDVQVWIATAEDTVLSKLAWSKRGGGSEMQLRDVAGIVAVQGDALDRRYVLGWATRLGVEDLWNKVLAALPSI